MTMVKFIRKRDGRLVPFEEEKITEAIAKAVRAVGGTDMERAGGIARQVAGILEVIYKDGRAPTVENVQDLVEKILIENGHAKVAKAYILYRQQHDALRRTREFMKESIESIDSYLVQEDWRVNENANMGYSLQGLNNHIAANITSNYWLNKIYPDYIADAHRDGDFHLHDLGMLSVYCCGWDLKDLLLKGFTGAYGKVQSGPPSTFAPRSGRRSTSSTPCRGRRPAPRPSPTSTPSSRPSSATTARLQGSQAGDPGVHLQHERPDPRRLPDPLHQHHHGHDPASQLASEAVIIGGKMMEETYGDFQEEMDLSIAPSAK
jgi:ribonucleoside-triphosphate reductase (formate)